MNTIFSNGSAPFFASLSSTFPLLQIISYSRGYSRSLFANFFFGQFGQHSSGGSKSPMVLSWYPNSLDSTY